MNKTIRQIVYTGVLTAIAIIIGVFVHFPLFGGYVYLIGIVTFLFPIFLRLDFALIGTISSVVIADVASGYGQYAWMSAIAYSAVTIILWLFSMLKFKLAYMVGTLIASLTLIAIYFLTEWWAFGLSMSIKDVFSTSLEMSIVFITTGILFRPAKLLSKALV